MKNLKIKITALLWRICFAIILLPVRLWRVVLHFQNGIVWFFKKQPGLSLGKSLSLWWVELVFLLLDVIAVAELYEILQDFLKWETRRLGKSERQVAHSVFSDSIDYNRVRIDERAYIACKHGHLCYVSFFTVNAWGGMRPDILIHELMHVWQYQHMGASYIPKALFAQTTPEGYNYGGVEGLKKAIHQGWTILHFNLEQQADIVSDYFRIREGLPPCWGRGTKEDLPVYEHFIKTIRSPGLLRRHFSRFA